MAVAPLKPATATGVGEHGSLTHMSGPVVVPLPSSPYSLSPQHSTVPSDSSEHAELPPAVMAITELGGPPSLDEAPPPDELNELMLDEPPSLDEALPLDELPLDEALPLDELPLDDPLLEDPLPLDEPLEAPASEPASLEGLLLDPELPEPLVDPEPLLHPDPLPPLEDANASLPLSPWGFDPLEQPTEKPTARPASAASQVNGFPMS